MRSPSGKTHKPVAPSQLIGLTQLVAAQRLGCTSHAPLEGLQTWPLGQTVVLHGGTAGTPAPQPTSTSTSNSIGKSERFIGCPR